MWEHVKLEERICYETIKLDPAVELLILERHKAKDTRKKNT